MPTITIEEAQARLTALIAELRPGEELVIIQQDRPVARLVAEPVTTRNVRSPGSAIGKLTVVQEDDTHLEDFEEHMP